MSDRAAVCPWCGRGLVVVHVHGHGQCGSCGTNVEPCCTGAAADTEFDEPAFPANRVDPGFCRRVFAGLGGTDRSVTLASLLTAVAHALGVGAEDARLVVELAVELGHLVRAGDVVHLGADAPPETPPVADTDGSPTNAR